MESASSPSRGRPRDPKLRETVLAATRDLIVEGGYAATTLQAVAERSGISRPTLYQRFGDRLSLIEDALFVDTEDEPRPSTGSLRRDIGALVRELTREFARPELRRGLPFLHAEAVEHRGREGRYWAPVLERWTHVFLESAARGERSRATAPEQARLALQMTIGALFFLSQAPEYTPVGAARRITSLLVEGIDRSPTRREEAR